MVSERLTISNRVAADSRSGLIPAAVLDNDLLVQAWDVDARQLADRRRPISASTLRGKPCISAAPSRLLVTAICADQQRCSAVQRDLPA